MLSMSFRIFLNAYIVANSRAAQEYELACLMLTLLSWGIHSPNGYKTCEKMILMSICKSYYPDKD